MAKLFIFAIGGSGERVLRSFNMLLAAGVDGLEKYDTYPIIIDYDVECKDQDNVRGELELYKKIHDTAFRHHEDATAGQFFGSKMKELNGLTRFTFPYAPPATEKKYSEHIGYGGLAGSQTKDFIDVLYNNSNDAITELNLDLTVGFKGNPNIGSVVFNDIKNKKEYVNFKTLFQEATDRVVIIGSLFGGTGASGIPELVKAIREDKPKACIATVFLLPYFTMERPDGGAINPALFFSKTKAALSFYKTSGTNKLINSRYYVGDPNPTRVRYAEGGKEQENAAHMVELAAAMFIAHFVNDNAAPNAMDVPYKFSLEKLDNGGHISAETAASANGHKTQFFYDDFDQHSKAVLQRLILLSLALKYHVEEVIPLTKDFQNTTTHSMIIKDKNLNLTMESNRNEQPVQDLCYYLGLFQGALTKWLRELDADQHPHRFTLLAECAKREYKDYVAKEFRGEQQTKTNVLGSIFASKPKQVDVASIETALDNALREFHLKTDIHLNAKAHEFVYIDILRRAMTGEADGQAILKKLKLVTG